MKITFYGYNAFVIEAGGKKIVKEAIIKEECECVILKANESLEFLTDLNMP